MSSNLVQIIRGHDHVEIKGLPGHHDVHALMEDSTGRYYLVTGSGVNSLKALPQGDGLLKGHLRFKAAHFFHLLVGQPDAMEEVTAPYFVDYAQGMPNYHQREFFELATPKGTSVLCFFSNYVGRDSQPPMAELHHYRIEGDELSLESVTKLNMLLSPEDVIVQYRFSMDAAAQHRFNVRKP